MDFDLLTYVDLPFVLKGIIRSSFCPFGTIVYHILQKHCKCEEQVIEKLHDCKAVLKNLVVRRAVLENG